MDDKSAKEYLIVEFPEEDTDGVVPMAVISSDWVVEQNGTIYCHWPNYFKSDLQKDRAIQNHSSLITEKCSLCPIEIKYNTGDYQKANAKLQRLENELESETDSEIQKRKPKKKIYSEYEEDYSEDDLNIPIAPQPKKFTTLRNMEVKGPKNNYAIQKNKSVDMSFMKEHDSFESQHEPRHELTIKKMPNKTILANENIGLSNQGISIRNGKSLPCKGCEENKALLNELLRRMESMREDVKYLMKLATAKNENLQIYLDEFPQFQNIEDISKYNEDLAAETNMATACSKFQLVGGKDAGETTRKILALMISHNLALKMNWSGRNDKGGFKNLKNIINLIHVSVRKNPLASKVTLSDVENSIKIWLRNAPDREGGRTKRTADKQNNQ